MTPEALEKKCAPEVPRKKKNIQAPLRKVSEKIPFRNVDLLGKHRKRKYVMRLRRKLILKTSKKLATKNDSFFYVVPGEYSLFRSSAPFTQMAK